MLTAAAHVAATNHVATDAFVRPAMAKPSGPGNVTRSSVLSSQFSLLGYSLLATRTSYSTRN